MIELTLSRELAGLLGANLEARCSANQLQQGLVLYQDKMVTHIWKDQFNIIHAIVRNVGTDSKLQIDLDVFAASECACGEARYCRHMAAVFYVLVQPYVKPEVWLQDVQTGLPSPVPQTTRVKPAALTSDDFVPASSGPESWIEPLTKALHEWYRRQSDRHRIDIFYYTAFKKLSARSESFADTEKAYYHVVCALLLSAHAEKHFAESGSSYIPSYYHRVAADLHHHFMDRIRDAVQLIDRSSLTDAQLLPYKSLIKKVLLEAIPQTSKTAFLWTEIHRFLWTNVLTDPVWRKAERVRLQHEIDSGMDVTGERSLLMGAHMDWLLGDDEAAMVKLTPLSQTALQLIMTYLETLAGTRSWKRLDSWLAFALPRLRRASGEVLAKALSIWREYARQTGDATSYTNALKALLPRSYSAYSHQLIQSGRLEEWAYFHLLNAIPPDKIDWNQLKEAELKAPSLVLPIYHHTVERLLAARSRSAYRDIVKLLKRLKELYLTMDAGKQYQAFIAAFTSRNNRLHALMEELEKGKLTP